MNKTYNALIVDDHKIIIKSYKEALKNVEQNNSQIEITSEEATDCDSALDELKKLSSTANFDLIILDIQLPPSINNEIFSGEELGMKIRKISPKIKIIVCTNLNDNLRLKNIVQSINPEGFLIKSDINFIDFVNAVEKVLIEGGSYYSKTITNLLRNQIFNKKPLDILDIKILREISNGARMKELTNLVPLSKASIEKRKKNLKNVFKIKNNSDRDLIIAARKKGFI